MSGSPRYVALRDAGAVRTLRLCRPDKRNALTAAMMREVAQAVRALPATCRAVVCVGEGRTLCAGADLQWMCGGDATPQSPRDTHALADMFAALAACPVPLVVVAHGAVRGGGCGLVAVADVALCARSATFAFPEVRLGLSPAVIAPYVLERLRPGAARAAFLTAEPLVAARALQLGLVDEVVDDDALTARTDVVVAALLRAGPRAAAATKDLLRQLVARPRAEHGALAASLLGELRAGAEARSGVAAFVARRPPPWSVAEAGAP